MTLYLDPDNPGTPPSRSELWVACLAGPFIAVLFWLLFAVEC